MLEDLNKLRNQEKYEVQQKLSKNLPRILELNLIAKELKKNVIFSAILKYNYLDINDIRNKEKVQKKKKKLQILVDNKEEKQKYIWNLSKFSSRYFVIKELLDEYLVMKDNFPLLIKEKDVIFFI